MSQAPTREELVRTRKSLHQVAEHVRAAARKRDSGHFTLRSTDTGFCTPPLEDGRVIAVEGTQLVVTAADGVRTAPLTTVRAAAELVGTTPGFPTSHGWATPLEPDAPLEVDPAATAVLVDWFALGHDALARLAAELADEDPTEPTLFPEHFDLGVTAAQVNYGISPGDEAVPEPYAYVGPFAGPPARDDFWNADFGAYRTAREVTTREEALAFFRACHLRLTNAAADL